MQPLLYKLPDSKAELRAAVAYEVNEFLECGGTITVCPPGVAQGASFSRNKSPFNNLKGVPAE